MADYRLSLNENELMSLYWLLQRSVISDPYNSELLLSVEQKILDIIESEE